MSREEESDRSMKARGKHEEQIALMLVDALWNDKWIRLALQDYEYDGKGFHQRGIVRELLGIKPSEDDRPSMRSLKYKLENLVLEKLRAIQYDIYNHEKTDKRSVTAADIFKPNVRRTVCYSQDVDEVSVDRYSWEAFQRTPEGRAKYLEYLRSKNIDPQSVVEIESV